MKKRYTKWMGRLLLAGLLLGAPLGTQAADIEAMRGGVTPKRARIVLSLDKTVKYTARTSGRQLIIDFKGDTERTQMVRLRDPRVKRATLSPKGKDSQLVIEFRQPVPEYKIFALGRPKRLVIDFPRAPGDENPAAANWSSSSQWLGKGLTYKQSTVNLGAGNVRTYVLTMTPNSEFKLDFIPGYGKTIQKGTLSMIARRSGAVSLVNASYFDSDIWVVGNLKIQNKWLASETTPRTGLVIDAKGQPSIETGLAYQGVVKDQEGNSMPISAVNRMRLSNELILFNDGYDTATDTNSYGTEVQLNGNSRVTAISSRGDMPLTAGYSVLSGNGQGARFLNGLRRGEQLTVTQSLGNARADEAPSVGSAGPLLVWDGLVEVTAAQEEIAPDIAQGRAPRTGVGIKKDGTVLVVVADGRSDVSAGMSLTEFARYFVSLGADRAMNFDGGGSSEMVVNGKVMNDPSDGEERPVRVALGFFRK